MSGASLTMEPPNNNHDVVVRSNDNFTQPESQNLERPSFLNDRSGFAEPLQQLAPLPQDVLYLPQSYFQSGTGYQQPHRNPEAHTTDNSHLMSFDLSGFLLPNGGGSVDNLPYEWFSNDFYSAMQETGNETFGFGGGEASNFPAFNHLERDLGQQSADQRSLHETQSLMAQDGNVSNEDADAAGAPYRNIGNDPGSVSRMASPPNEASEEDKWAFAWDPKSRAILYADPIHIPLEHPLLLQHKSKFDISEQTYQKVQRFISSRIEGMSHYSTLTLPTLQEANVMIGLYFEHFSPKMPVLHHATLNTNEDLPPPLLGAMIVIGAIYSQLRGTRRFAIVLLDIVRWHLEVAIECDNSLMRDPKIIFAETLICYAGLWCGNKRAFELAEVVRATVVKQVRSAHFWREDRRPLGTEREDLSSKDTLKDRWLQWVQKEFHRRLFWIVYALDTQFTSLLYLPAMFSMGEVCDMYCPCDEEFWAASSARHWKSLLGPALIPPARFFSAAAAPFLWSHWNWPELPSPGQQARPGSTVSHQPVHGLNDWSAFLVLVTMQNQIFQFSQEQLFWNSCFGDEDEGEKEHTSINHLESGPKYRQNIRKKQFKRKNYHATWFYMLTVKDALSLWQDAYLSNPTQHDSYATSVHFHESSITGHVLAHILLDVPFTDIHGAFGKNGKEGIAAATVNFRRWVNADPQTAEDIIQTALKTIEYLVTNRASSAASEQSIIAMFLCYVLVWLYANIAPMKQRQGLLNRLARDEQMWKCPQLAYIKRELESTRDAVTTSNDGNSSASRTELTWGVLRSAAQCLTQLGTWGAALNLALLLQRRSEM